VCYGKIRNRLTRIKRREKMLRLPPTPPAVRAEDYLELKAYGLSRREAAERMGISKKTLEKALQRAGVRDG
jgi:DNA-directed RNA polymerase specialized sigma24 family protein